MNKKINLCNKMVNKTYIDKKSRKKIKLIHVVDNYGYGITDDGEIIKVSLDDLQEESSNTKVLDEKYLNKIMRDLIEIEKIQSEIDEIQEKIIYLVDDKSLIKR